MKNTTKILVVKVITKHALRNAAVVAALTIASDIYKITDPSIKKKLESL